MLFRFRGNVYKIFENSDGIDMSKLEILKAPAFDNKGITEKQILSVGTTSAFRLRSGRENRTNCYGLKIGLPTFFRRYIYI